MIIYWNVVIASQLGPPHKLALLLGLTAMLPLMEGIGSLLKFAQKWEVFICDFIVAMKVCQGQHYRLYSDNNTTFTDDEFCSFNALMVCNHQQIHLR